MYFVYILYSMSSRKTYVGYTNDINRRIREHNITESNGFTLRYRPWTLIRTEHYASKSEALEREKYLKTGKGREEVKLHVVNFLDALGAVSAVAEKD
jgi:putative endonuclease